MDRPIDCKFMRRFGVEIELNTRSGIAQSLPKGVTAEGSDEFAKVIKEATKRRVSIQAWNHNYNNEDWIVKPDSSCGVEICTPVLKGNLGLAELLSVIDSLKRANMSSDSRCSFHVHIDVKDLTEKQVASLLAWYIKCEHIFLDSIPLPRRSSRYCQMLGLTDLFTPEMDLTKFELIENVGRNKYYTINLYHFLKGGGFIYSNNRKKTIEFRIGESDLCLDSNSAKNWILFLMNFVEVFSKSDLPAPFSKGDSMTGLCWIDPHQKFDLLGFNKKCTQEFHDMKMWFLKRIKHHGFDYSSYGPFSKNVRSMCMEDFMNYYDKAVKEYDALIVRE